MVDVAVPQLGESVTEGTIKVYLHAVFQKLGVSSRTELAIRASEFLTKSYMSAEGGKTAS